MSDAHVCTISCDSVMDDALAGLYWCLKGEGFSEAVGGQSRRGVRKQPQSQEVGDT